MENNKVKIISSENLWMEGEAIRQLNKTAELEGMQYVVGMPDLHPGRGNPIGAVFIAEDMIYPYLIGNDVGCGVALFQTDLKTNKIKKDKFIKQLDDLDEPLEDQMDGLGTIGGGNHFAELQVIDKVFDQDVFADFKLNKKKAFILVHSGSRGIGERLLRKHTEKYGAKGLHCESVEAQTYIKEHDQALNWAVQNRNLIAQRFAEKIKTEALSIVDLCHNNVTKIEDNKWLHRKGAISSESNIAVIPGSRGTLSYIVKPKGDHKLNVWSLPHGAGRKWNRSNCKGRLKNKYQPKALIKTKLGSHVICEDKELLYEEAPQAYKNIDEIIQCLLKENLVEVVATLKPVITYKTRKRR